MIAYLYLLLCIYNYADAGKQIYIEISVKSKIWWQNGVLCSIIMTSINTINTMFSIFRVSSILF